LPPIADEWLADAVRHEGSWWPEWNAWVSAYGGDKVQARVPGAGKLKAIEDAPGSYVKLRLDPAASSTPAPAASTPLQTPVTAASRGPVAMAKVANVPAARAKKTKPAS